MKKYLHLVTDAADIYRKEPDDPRYQRLDWENVWQYVSFGLPDPGFEKVVCETKFEREARLQAIQIVLKKLQSRKPGKPEAFNKSNPMYQPGDEQASLFSESYLYILFGKDEARTILSWLRWIAVLSKVSGTIRMF